MGRIATVLVYVVDGDDVLLMRRNKEPNLGLWVAPGGKIEVAESPYDAAARELLEETGLTVSDLKLRGLCTEVSPLPDWQWMLFIYVARSHQGVLRPDLREGKPAWISIGKYLSKLPIPQADKVFAPSILEQDEPLFEAKFVYDADLVLVDWLRY